MTSKTNGALLLYYVKLCASFGMYSRIQTGVSVRKRSIWVEIGYILSRVTLKFDGWPWKQGISSVLNQALCIISNPSVKSNLDYSPETLNSGQNWLFVVPRDLQIWWMTLKNNRAPLLYHIKLWASIQSHGWIQTGITARNRLKGVMTSVTVTFDLWLWPFAWTLRLSLVITQKYIITQNFRMIWWQEIVKKVWQTDGRTNGRTDGKKCS